MIVLYSAPPASAPDPRFTARSMLSLGTEDFLAFWIASYSVGLPAGSPPPIRAATSMFLISFANILPRRAAVTAFLCLVVAPLEWPDISGPFPVSGPGSALRPASSTRRGRGTAGGCGRRLPPRDGRTWPSADPVGPRRSYPRPRRCRRGRAPRRRGRRPPPRER